MGENKFHRWPKSLELISLFGKWQWNVFFRGFLGWSRGDSWRPMESNGFGCCFWHMKHLNNNDRQAFVCVHHSVFIFHRVFYSKGSPHLRIIHLQCKYANSLPLMKVYITATCSHVWFAYSNSASWKVAFQLRGYINHMARGVTCICNHVLFTTCLLYPFFLHRCMKSWRRPNSLMLWCMYCSLD